MKTVRWRNAAMQQGWTMVPNVLLAAAISAQAFKLWIILADLARQDESCWPGQQRLAAMLGVSARSIRDYIAELRSAGFLETEQRGLGKTNMYVLCLPDRQDSATQERNDSAIPSLLENEGEEDNPLAAAPRERKTNVVWDALVEVCGAPTTRSERGDFGKTVSELRAVIPEGATREDVQQAMGGRRTRWVQRFPDAVFTHRVLRTHWSDLGYGLRSELEPRRLTADDDLEDDGTGRRTF